MAGNIAYELSGEYTQALVDQLSDFSSHNLMKLYLLLYDEQNWEETGEIGQVLTCRSGWLN